MALPEQYLVTTKNLSAFFNSLVNAQPPAKFTNKFLEQLEFKSTNDRLYIGVLKALKFVDANGVPQERYFRFIDQTQSKQVLAEAIKDAYSDLFAVNKKANEMIAAEVKNKLRTLFQGAKTDNVLTWMANTFHALCNYADFSQTSQSREILTIKNDEPQVEEMKDGQASEKMTHELISKKITTEMHYNIQIHFPETRDITVYDAIFKSLKEHLL
ncbi:DUF5343 domain-containing protein [Thermoflavifilum thermophilum]|uniref:DUF5343 domain-containing protein n=1 Tax=Thermoflavifilum thermophilum TaxID=1393122 RepID=A0A1I7NFB3_9BACT|nr:DUF5343 domain-containing protein [Thermoflavifilum thermophilum]SFV33362.1 hypothetical protein SAMN05660895_1661 [Thermoflavifilum thermophilum]